MDLNNIGVLRHKGKTLEKDCHKAHLLQRSFFDGAHLTGEQFDDAFYVKTKVEVKEKLAHSVGNYYKKEAKNDLNMRITMNELKQAIKKMKTNNKGVDPYGLHPKLLKKFKFNTNSTCLHLINCAFFMGIWPLDRTIVNWHPSRLYTNQVRMFLHSTARCTSILNPGYLAIIPQHITMVRLLLIHKLSVVIREPDEIRAIYIQKARQSSVSAFKKKVDEYCRHLWQREKKQCLLYSNYSGLKVRNSIMKMLAP